MGSWCVCVGGVGCSVCVCEREGHMSRDVVRIESDYRKWDLCYIRAEAHARGIATPRPPFPSHHT